ncbi:hypothetical protein UPYG_G00261760 [Umbra pygmaea]|uniref:DUF4806 domain-containing protein n=1 Tax=Umbra pygmaea TaxID=75934 RepID=A0ABD0WDV6_UMBPY
MMTTPTERPTATTTPGRATPVTPVERLVISRVLTILEDIKETQRIHGTMLSTLLKQRDANTVTAELPEGAHFPINTVPEVEAMEEKLLDTAFLNEVVSVLGEIGGTTIDEATRRMMGFLMTNDLAIQYNFVGRHGKREFRSLRLFEVVYGGLKKNMLTRHINRRDAEKSVSKWFSGSRDRGGNRALRAQKDLERRMSSGQN